MDVDERTRMRVAEGLEYGMDSDIEALEEINAVMKEISSMKEKKVFMTVSKPKNSMKFAVH